MGLLNDFIDDRIKKSRSKVEEPSLLGALKDPQFRQDVKRGLLDSLNRGAVASTIGGPVDVATMLMRPLGYNVEKPVGGSEWVGDKMQQLGLLGDYRNPVAEALASVAVPGAMTKAGQGLFKAEQAAIQNANIAGPLSGGKFATQRGVFGGINAKTADKAKLAQAEQMLNKGVDPAQVWKETGWGRGPDGKWRFEISDDAAKLEHPMPQVVDLHKKALSASSIDDAKKVGEEYNQWMDWARNSPAMRSMSVREAGDTGFIHPDLVGAYPEPSNQGGLPRIWWENIGSAKGGEYAPAENRVKIAMGHYPDPEGSKSVALHELQHAIQQREGFARGGSPEQFQSVPYADLVKRSSTAQDALIRAREAGGVDPQTGLSAKTLNESIDGLSQQIASWKDPHQQYLSLGGEAEARLVQSRMNLTPEERLSQYPWDADYFKQQTGVGLDDLIHRFDGGEARSIDDYAGMHRPPMKDNGGAPLHDLTGGGEVYPDDIYSPKAVQYYGTGDAALDRGTIRKINAYKGNPDAPVTMYRAVPSSVPEGSPINNGDWVTINPDYAKMHGESALGGDYRILQQQVPARKLFTNGDSIHEFGYDESGKINPLLLGILGGGSAAGYGLLRDR